MLALLGALNMQRSLFAQDKSKSSWNFFLFSVKNC